MGPFSAQRLLFPFQTFQPQTPNDPQRFVPNTRLSSNPALSLQLPSSLLTHPCFRLAAFIYATARPPLGSVSSRSCSSPQARNLINHRDPRIFLLYGTPALQHDISQPKDFICHSKD